MSTRSSTEFRLERRFHVRLYFFTAVILALSAICALQLGNLQVLHGAENHVLSRKFVSKQEFKEAPRGFIYDRNLDLDNPLVQNILYIDFNLYPGRFKTREEAVDFLKRFCSIMGYSIADYSEILQPDQWKQLSRKNEEITLIHRVSRAQQVRLASLKLEGQKAQFVTRFLRYYTMGPALAHITGYTGPPSRREIKAGKALSYQTLGKAGVEDFYDTDLRGKDGILIRNKVLDNEDTLERSEQGNHLVLNIDRAVQAAAYRALIKSGKRGAAIAIRPATGEVVAMVSAPTYDPNILSSGTGEVRTEHIRKVRLYNGFLNLAIQTKFPPASTFKPLVALSALESFPDSFVNKNTTFNCPGKWSLESSVAGVPDSVYYCHRASGHGVNNMIGAIAHSCNVYFYRLGYKIGPTPIIEYAKSLGLNKKTGIDLPGEVEGFVPDQKWKQITWSSRWYDGDTINLSIGQGFLQVTPVEMAVMFSAILNGGKVLRPHVLKEVRDSYTGRVVRQIRPEKMSEVPLSRSHIETVEKGMRAVITAGTARYLNRPDMVPVAGKTGTAQTRSERGGRDHAWFVGFAPYGAPVEEQLLVVVFVEYGIAGSYSAAPVAIDMFQAAYPDWDRPLPEDPAKEMAIHPEHPPGETIN